MTDPAAENRNPPEADRPTAGLTTTQSADQRRQYERMDRPELEDYQLHRLNQLLSSVQPTNPFYADKFADLRLPLQSLGQLSDLPFTTKAELQSDESGLAANRTFDLPSYARLHRTSGTHGRPMLVHDTAADWQWWIDTWQYVLDAAEITSDDRVLMAFSFGPFIGFWSANDALLARGTLVIPAGGLSSLARLEMLQSTQATAMCCTPSYALHLAEVAQANGLSVADSNVTRIIVAGEPGGSIPSVRQRIESAWQARVVDHSGATEIGPWGYASADDSGLHVVEAEFIAEFESIATRREAEEGELSELIITTLGREGCPVIRYRTGDLVRPRWEWGGTSENRVESASSATEPQNRFVFLDGGVLGRTDDMVVIRGVNVFPSALEQIIREFPEVAEFRITATKQGQMDALSVEVEDQAGQPDRIAQALQLGLGLNIRVTNVPADSLPRFEAKGKRFVDQR